MHKFIFGLFSAVITFIALSNSFELLANQLTPLGFSLYEMQIQVPINKTIQEFSIKRNSQLLNSNAKLGPLDTLDFQSLHIQVQLEEARKISDTWYQRPSLGEYVELNKDALDNPIDYLIYLKKGWRSIPYAEEIEVGAGITLSTKSGRQVEFTVESREVLPKDSSLIVGKSERRQIILMIEDSENSRYFGYSLISN